MTEQSQRSSTASGTAGKESSNLEQANERLKAMRRDRGVSDEPPPIAASLPATPAKRESSDERERKLEAAKQAARENLAREAWSAARVPARHRAAVGQHEGGEWSAKLETLRGWLGTGFLVALLGDRGTGKTQLAADLVHHHCHHWQASALYVRAVEIFMAIKEAYRPDGPTESQQLAKFARPDLLVIDEAHDRGETEWENRLLTLLIDRRYAECKDTLLISNQRPEAFKASIGESIYSRLVETGGVIVCGWPSYRKAAP